MWHIGPILRSLAKRKLSVFLLALQIAIVTAIFSNSVSLISTVYNNINTPSGISDDLLFAIALRPVDAFIDYNTAQEDLRDIRAIDSVASATAVRWTPLSFFHENANLRTESDPEASATNAVRGSSTHELLETLELPLLAGRNFGLADMAVTEGYDQPGPSKVIITQALAEKLFSSVNEALGKFVYEGDTAREIIGVTENWWGFSRSWNNPHELTVFYPAHNNLNTEYRYLVRASSSRDRAAVVEAVSAALYKNYNNNVLLWVEKIDENRAAADKPNIIYAWMFIVMMVVLGFFIAFAICAQMLFFIAQRTKQIGIRRALGASHRDIVIHLQIENMLICMCGLILGLLITMGVSHALQVTIEEAPIAPWIILASSLSIIAICFSSATIPAWRAANISPSMATRSI